MGGDITQNRKTGGGETGAGKSIDDNEVEERIAVLKRFRDLLAEQRRRFQNYLLVLEKQKTSIKTGSAEELSAHVEMEEKIIADIFTVQKSIEPMRDMFEFSWQGHNAPDIEELKSSLHEMKNEASRRVVENKKLLQNRLIVLRSEIKNLKANPFKSQRRTVYNDDSTASLLDIKG
jgi:uncharacterized small protein (DUF1192 family)